LSRRAKGVVVCQENDLTVTLRDSVETLASCHPERSEGSQNAIKRRMEILSRSLS